MNARPSAGSTDAASARYGGFFAHHGPWAPGVRLFRQLRFAWKAVILTLAFAPLLALLAWQSVQADREASQARRDAVRLQVEAVHGAVAALHGAAQRGELPADAARAIARTLGAAPDSDARIPVRITEGPVGSAIAEVGSGPGADVIAHAKAFEPWGWSVAAAVPTDDLRAAAAGRWMRVGSVAIGVALLAAYLFASFFKVLDGGLKETRRHLHAMTAGDLTTAPRPWGRDEAAQLMHDVRAMQEAIRSIVVDVRAASDAIVVASGDIAASATDLSGRTEQAATRLERTASSMTRIADTVGASAGHAAQAATIAGENSAAAADAGRTMGRVVATMGEIGVASARIREIIGTIDGIAFQTNILALNAAVEAARAGESGRGFAVVAAEVRRLAQRSAEAARQIRTLIADSVRSTDTGSEVVREAGEVIDRVVSSASRLEGLIERIADGAREQAVDVGQVGEALGELDRATQRNAALVEQTAGSTASLRGRADALAERVARFRIEARG
jgi:methyl-accepting chemotaxis protein